MKFGELTIAQILLSAFSGFAVVIISWVIGKKAIVYFKSRDKGGKIVQKDNRVGGSMAGGHIIETNKNQPINAKRDSTIIEQSGNKVNGDMAGGNIIKKKE